MPGETRPQPSSEGLALERIHSARFQLRESIEEEPLRELDAEVEKLIENLQPSNAMPPDRARALARLRNALHWEQDEIAKLVNAHKRVVSRMLALLRQPDESVADESKRVEPAAQATKERLTETVRRMREAAKSARVKANDEAMSSAPAATAIELRAPEPATSIQSQKIEQRIAKWRIAVGTLLRGRWREAVWDFYERMTDVAVWWRIIKPVLKFLGRFVPYGHEPEPSRLSKAIKECFRQFHEPPYTEPLKPETKPPKDAT